MTRATLASVIVTYHPDEGFGARLAAIARECGPVLIVDNSADESVCPRLRATCAAAGAELVENAANLGLGAALNQAFAQLAARGCAGAIAFDQDSTPAPGFAAALLDAAGTDASIAVVGANWHDEARPGVPARHLQPRRCLPFFFRRCATAHGTADVTCVITSGSLFRLATWRELGGFDESLFLDLVDTEYCLRARAAGRRVVVAAAAQLAHRRGAKRAVRRLGRTWWPAFMPPRRLQYLFRNRLLVARRHGGRAPHWLAFELTYAAKILLEVALLEECKGAKLAACLRGSWDGLRGRRGPIDRA